MADLTGVDPALAMKVQALINASHGRITVNSGFRTHDQQAKLYAQEGPRLAAPPGHSNHERGLAVDLGGDSALIAQLAPQFGLILPMSWEPWHVELPDTRKGSSGGAYTPSPYGDVSPTVDPNIASSPQYTLASAANALSELSGLGEMTGPVTSETSPALGEQTTPAQLTQSSASYSTTPGQGQSGAVKPDALYKMLRAQGLDAVHAAALVSIAGRESGFNPAAYNGNVSTGDNSHGLFQINTLGGQHSQYELGSVAGQVAAAVDMVQHGGLQPWGPYKNVSWSNGTNLQTGADASGGEVSLAQLQGIVNEGLH